MQVSGIKKDIEQLRKSVSSNGKRTLTEEEFWEDISKERILEGGHPVIFLYRDFKNVMINEIFYEPNLEKIDEFRIMEGKFPLLSLYLAGEYKKVENELRKYEASFFRKIPRSTLLEERLQPLADACGFDDIDGYHEAERLFMQDQNLYHLHNKPELSEEFIKYLMSEREKEGANQLPNNDSLVKVTTEQLIPDKIKKSLKLIGSIAGEYRLTLAVQEMGSFGFGDSVSVPGQTITVKYAPTGQYKGVWSAEYSHTGKILPIQNITLWVWVHQRDINRKLHEIVKEHGENEPAAD
ncbi:MAG: hypothetical protein ACYDEF_10760 [Methanosarcina sp.]